jgi:2-polyprenyl-3-methyl-5-hydroxy-6-metoxy-1,4-benzoquinol methylase
MDRTKIAIEIFNKYAKEYQDKYMDLVGYHGSLDLFCQNVNRKNADILDIACGPGNITQYILKQRPDFKILGIDLSPKMVELARTNNPEAEFQIMDCRDINKLGKKYDAILCGFCLPYLSKEEALNLIMDISGILVSGGIFYISTMEDDYEKSGYESSDSGAEGSMYIFYHQSDYLMQALKDNGFEIIDLKRKEYPEEGKTTKKNLVIVVKK